MSIRPMAKPPFRRPPTRVMPGARNSVRGNGDAQEQPDFDGGSGSDPDDRHGPRRRRLVAAGAGCDPLVSPRAPTMRAWRARRRKKCADHRPLRRQPQRQGRLLRPAGHRRPDARAAGEVRRGVQGPRCWPRSWTARWAPAFLHPQVSILISQRAGGLRWVDRQGGRSLEPLKGTPDDRGPHGDQHHWPGPGPRLRQDPRRSTTTTPQRRPAKGAAPMGHVLKAKPVGRRAQRSRTSTTIYEAANFAPRRIVQARDGTLLIPSAEVASRRPEPAVDDRSARQDPAHQDRRFDPEATIRSPKDAPANPALSALGFRDIQGAALNPATGDLWVGENEPMGGDELNPHEARRQLRLPEHQSSGRQNSSSA